MQKIETPDTEIFPPAARLKDRTQPMGPLEQGDQALVDAAARVFPERPAGRHIIQQHEDGSTISLFRHESPGQTSAFAEITSPDGHTERVNTVINKQNLSGGPAITADIAEWPAGKEGKGNSVALVVDNNVEASGGSGLNMQHDRQKAQAIKLEVAGKIDAAREHLGKLSVEGARRAA